MKHFNLTFLSFLFLTAIFFGIVISTLFTKDLSQIILQGRSFEGRSELIKNLLYTLFSVIFCTLYMLVTLFICNALQKCNSFMRFYHRLKSVLVNFIRSIEKSNYLAKIMILLILILGFIFFVIHVKVISFPYQLELREGNETLTTYAFLKGINPYSILNNPVFINVYGILYNLLVLPFTFIFGNSLQLHRMISAVLILCQLILIARVMNKDKNNVLSILIAVLFIWLSQISLTSPLARPDALGQILFLVTVLIPYMFKFNSKSLFFSVITGALSFQTKMYFLMGVVITASYLFLFISMRKAIIYAFFSGAAVLFTVIIINSHFESYFVNTLYLYSAVTSRNLSHLFRQCIKFLKDYWSLLLIGLGIITQNVNFISLKKIAKSKIINMKNFDQPLFNFKINLIVYALLISTLSVLLIFGQHSGNFQIYFYHLITPFFIIIIFSIINHQNKFKNCLLAIAFLSLLTQSYENLKPDLNLIVSKDWMKLENMIIQSGEILNSPIDVSILIDHNKPIAMSGYTQYFFMHPNKDFFLYPDMNKINSTAERYLSDITDKVIHKKYDFIETFQNENYELLLIGERLIQSRPNGDFISDYYHLTEILTISMPHTYESWKIGIWKPN